MEEKPEDYEDDQEGATRIYIREASEIFNRRMGTIRRWEQEKVLPPHLMPQRGYRGWRYWTEPQISQIKQWIIDSDRRPGKGLPHYNPTEKDLDRAIEMMRKPRKVQTSHLSD